MFWQCNVALVIAAIGSLLGKNDIVGAAVASVALDQTLWWVDMFLYIATGKYLVGVANYLSWPETTWTKVATSTHHLWFIPLCVILNGLPSNSFALSIILVAFMAIYTRLVIPFEISYKGKYRYMNINCTYECWKDVKIPFLHLADRNNYTDKHFAYGFTLLNATWNTGNFICFSLIDFLYSRI